MKKDKEKKALQEVSQQVDHLSTSFNAAQHKTEREKFLVKNQKSQGFDYSAVNIKNILRLIK